LLIELFDRNDQGGERIARAKGGGGWARGGGGWRPHHSSPYERPRYDRPQQGRGGYEGPRYDRPSRYDRPRYDERCRHYN